MPQGGHNIRPHALHVLHGTDRSNRQRKQKVAVTTKPRKPRGLDRVASAHWDFVLKHRAAWVAQSDGPALATMCRAWSMLQRATREFADDPLDAPKRLAYATLAKEWAAGAARFGLTLTDRERLGSTSAESSRNRELEEKYLA